MAFPAGRTHVLALLAITLACLASVADLSVPAFAQGTGDTTAPETELDSGPSGITTNPDPTFTFYATEAGATFECRMDAGEWAPCTSPQSYSGLASSVHTFEVRAKDAAGNVDESPASRTFTVDSIPPETQIDSGPSGSTTDASPSFEFSASELAFFECNLDDGGFEPCVSPVSYSSLAPGSHTFEVRATDTPGNTDPSPATRLFSVTLDTGPPETQIDSGPMGPTSNASPSFTFSSSKVGSTFECRMNTGTWASCSSPESYSNLGSGAHTFEVRATSAGVTDASPASRSFSVDAAAPQTQINSGPAGLTSNPSPSFSFSSSEAGSTFECKLDTGAWASCTSPRSYAGLSDGPHTFEARASDAAGNTDTTPAARSFTVETVAPQTQIDSGPTGTVANASPAFSFSSNDEGSTFECRLDSGSWGSCTSPSGYPGLSEGAHTFEVRAVDEAGNIDPTPASRSFAIDVTAPESQINSGPSGFTTNASPSFGFTSNDPGAMFECRLDGSAWTSCEPPRALSSLSESAHLFEVRATDALGNVEASPAQRSFTVDTSAPDTQIDSGPSGITGPAPAVSFSSDEPGAAFECRLDAGGWAACESPLHLTGLAAGQHTIEVRAKDGAGLTDETPASRQFTVDISPPQLTITVPRVKRSTATFQLAAEDAESGITRLECRLDGGAWRHCETTHTIRRLKSGRHELMVRSWNGAGMSTSLTKRWKTRKR
jgi:hypothetical protein